MVLNGILSNYAPRMLKGAMKQYLGSIKFDDMVAWVSTNRNLWKELPDNYKKTFTDYGPKLGKMEWFTYEWVIESGKESAPVLASLLLGWPEGKTWLECQVIDIKKHIKDGV
jgi:hypothetical protein